MDKPPVTVLGLGAMGRALVSAFVAAGHPTTVWNRSPGRAAGLGATEAATVPEAVRASPIVVICLLNEDAVSATLAEVGDALAGRVVVDLTNSTPAQARARAAGLDESGAAHLDGGIMAVPPMIGGEHALVLYSGAPEAFERARATLSALGTAHYLGADPGSASLHDIALLSAMYGMLGGALQAFGLIRSAGVTAVEFLPLLDSWLTAMSQSLPPMAEEIDTGPAGSAGSPLAMQAAAFDNLLVTAREQGLRELLLAPIGQLLDEAVAAGHGRRDIAAVAELLARRH